MKKNVAKNAFYRGFTLIELMIVIVILGVLMGTILPRLSSAQARSRDLGRVADLNTISQALETYFDDHGKYPGKPGDGECLIPDTASPKVATLGKDFAYHAIKEYLKANEVPTPPASKQKITLADETCVGSYFYAVLKKRGLKNNGYILAIDMETYQNANYLLPNLSGKTWGSQLDVNELTSFNDAITLSTDKKNRLNTIYVVVN